MKRSCYQLLLLKPANLSYFQAKESEVKVKELVVEKQLTLLPTRPGVCPCCAVDHPADEAHNPQSLHCQFWFLGEYDRSPTWRDAIAHCPDHIKSRWEFYLTKVGIDIDSTNLVGVKQTIR